jgi:hypothetical protein
VVAAFGFVMKNFSLAAVSLRTVPVVRVVEGVVEYEAEVSFVKKTIVQHLTVPWLKNS